MAGAQPRIVLGRYIAKAGEGSSADSPASPCLSCSSMWLTPRASSLAPGTALWACLTPQAIPGVLVSRGISLAERERLGAPLQRLGIPGYPHESQGPVGLDDLSEQPRSVGLLPGPSQMKTFACASNRHAGGPLASLCFGKKADTRKPTPEEEQLVILVVERAATAVWRQALSSPASRMP